MTKKMILAGIRDEEDKQVKITLKIEILNCKVGDQDTENKTIAFIKES
ncbi:hypothetical protein [Bacillus sp. 2205SS5-2]